ncbi:MAG: hypothetical protein NT001_01200, partial [Candidatus Woesearchaeota archaeon]|nr:hypothetical protein [Candidatus Woesearchaeota archaeon]
EYKSCSPNPTLGNSPYGYATGQIQRTSPSNEDCAAYGKEPDFTYLIADTDFTDVNAAKPEQIQAFFDKMGSAVKDPVDGVLLSQAIYDAGQKYQISPIVLLATLQKEQSLLTQKSLTQRQKDYAAGCGCPDTSSCNEKYKGFQNQMECMAAILKKHYDAGAKLDYPYTFKGLNYDNKKCSNGQPTELDIKNAATYSLYKYTPHTYDYCLSTKGGANFNFRNLYIKYYQDITSSQPACRATTGLETETVVTESGEQKTYIVRTIGKYKINPSFSVTADYDFSQYDTIKKQVRGYGGNKGVLDLVADCERSDSSSSAPGSLPASNLGECVNSAVNTVNSRQEMKDSNLLMFNGPCDPRENLLSDFIEGFGDCSKSEDDDCYCEINLEQSGQPDFKEDVEINVKKEGSGTIISLANIGKDVVKNTGNIWSYSFDNALKEEKTLSVKGGKGTLYVKKETGTTSTMSVSDKAPENTKKCGVEKRKFKFCVQQAKEGKGNAPLNYDFALEFADSIPPAPVENLKAKDKKDAKSSIIIEFYAPKENGVIVPDLKDYLVYCSSTAFIKDSAGNLILDGLSLLTIIEPKDENGFMQTINEEITYCEDAEIKDGQQYYIAVTPIDWNNNEGIAREVSAISIDDSVSMPAPE